MSTISGVSTAQKLLNAFDLSQSSSTDDADDDVYRILESKGGSAANISTAAALLSRLSTLQKNDSTEFKTAAGDICSSLRDAADDASSTLSASELNTLAGLFSNAASSGSLTSLTSGGSSSLKGYGSSGGGLLSTYLSLDSSVFGSVNSIISSAISAAESEG